MIKNLTLSAIPTLHSENDRVSLCPDSYFAQGQCSAKSRNRDNSRIVLDKVGILRKVGIGTILELSWTK